LSSVHQHYTGNNRSTAARIEAACSPSFTGASRSRSYAYPAGIAACLADGDFDLLGERLRSLVDPRPGAAQPTRPNSGILALIPCHNGAIDMGTSPYKRCQASIASNRMNAHHGEETAVLLIHARCERHRLED
jgi:hypothetical protein